MIRTRLRIPISRFCAILDIPRRTYAYRLKRHRERDAQDGGGA